MLLIKGMSHKPLILHLYPFWLTLGGKRSLCKDNMFICVSVQWLIHNCCRLWTILKLICISLKAAVDVLATVVWHVCMTCVEMGWISWVLQQDVFTSWLFLKPMTLLCIGQRYDSSVLLRINSRVWRTVVWPVETASADEAQKQAHRLTCRQVMYFWATDSGRLLNSRLMSLWIF